MSDSATARRCFVCGPDNPISLGCRFERDGQLCVSEFTSRPEHSGYDGVTHGGIIFSLLDDVMANWLWLNGDVGFTARCEIRYRRRMPVGTRVRVEGWQEKRRGRMAQLAARLVDLADGEVIAEADARFMIEPAQATD